MPHEVPLDDALVRRVVTTWPTPVADAMWRADGALENPHERLLANLNVFYGALRYLGALALAVRVDRGAGPGGDPAAVQDLLKRMRWRPLLDGQWQQLTRELLRPWARDPAAHPLPELVRLYHDPRGRDVEAFDAMVALRNETAHPFKPDLALVLALTARALPLLHRCLAALEGLMGRTRLAVPLAGEVGHAIQTARLLQGVPSYDGRAWRTSLPVAANPLPAGQAVLVDEAGRVLVPLHPVVLVRPPTPDSPVQAVFFLDGGSKGHGSYLALPSSAEHSEPGVWAALDARLQTAGAAVATAAGTTLERPFRGLLAFRREDAELFFGRDPLVDALANRIRQHPFVTVLGPSGSGKTSLLQAGVGPALERRPRELAEAYRSAEARYAMVVCRPFTDPLTSLRAALLAGLEGLDGDDTAAAWSATAESLAARVTTWARLHDRIVVLVVDQGEELFTLCTDADRRDRFAATLAALARDPRGPLRVVYVIREDFFGRLGDVAALKVLHALQPENVRPPDAAALQDTLIGPARRFGARFEDGLAARMVREVAAGPAALAVLQFTADRLWDACKDTRLLTTAAYEALGGVVGALTRYADEVVGQTTGPRALAARELLLALVSSEGTRAVVSRDELLERARDAAVAGPVCDALVAARLLTASQGADGQATVEFAHEALLTQWATLRRWRDEDVEGHAQRAGLAEATRTWTLGNQADDLLWRGHVLAAAVAWRARTSPRLTEVERAFLDRSASADTMARRLRWMVGAAVTLVVSVFALVATLQWRDAGRQRAVALHQRADALHQAAEATREARLAEYEGLRSRGAELDAAGRVPEAAVAFAAAAQREAALGRPQHPALDSVTLASDHPLPRVLRGHTGDVTAVAMSADGTRVVTGSRDGTARVWDAATGAALHTLQGHTDAVTVVAMSADGTRVVTGSRDGTARVWDAATGAALHTLQGYTGDVSAVAISADGTRVVTGSRDGTARVWDAATGAALHTLQGYTGGVSAVAISADGTRVVTGSLDHTARVWDAATGAALHTLQGYTGGVSAVAISADGTRVVTGAWEHTARVWDAATGAALHTLQGHTGGVSAVAISADGTRVVTGSYDATARVWDAATGAALHTLQGHTDAVTVVAISADGTRVVTGSWDHTARVWDAATGTALHTLQGHIGGVFVVAISADGTRVVTGSLDHTARVWDAATGAALHTLQGHTGGVFVVAISADGTRVVTGSEVGSARVWDAAMGAALHTLQGHTNLVSAAAISADGTRVVTGSWDHTARVWDAATGATRHVLQGHAAEVTAVAISADGTRVVTGSWDHTARVWDAATGAALHTLQGHTGGVFVVAISADGTRVVTGSRDGTARVWDTATGATRHVLQGHAAEVTAVAISADGTRVVTGSSDRTARVWDAATGATLHVLQGHAAEVIAVAISADGTRVVTGSRDGTARIWRSDPSRVDVTVPAVLRRTNLRLCHDTLEVIAVPFGHDLPTDPWASPADCAAAVREPSAPTPAPAPNGRDGGVTP